MTLRPLNGERDQRANMEKVRIMAAREPCSTPPPKLSFYSLPIRRPENPGTATPPLRLPVSVPYNWEEAPGKPKKNGSSSSRKPFNISGEQVRRLELPPRMLAAMLGMTEASKSRKTFSPTSGSPHGSCYSFSFAEGTGEKKERVVWSWSKAKRSPGERKMSLEDQEGLKVDSCDSTSTSSICSCSCSSSSTTSDASSSFGQIFGDHVVASNVDQNKSNVRILRLRRSRSLASATTARLWASIYKSMKQVMSRS